MARGQAERLVPMLAEVMAEAGLGWGAIDLIAVTVGPGAFTGLRIGLAAARGMALASAIPVAGVTTFEAIAHALPAAERQGRTLVVAIDSKRADLFIQAFDEDLCPLGPAAGMLPADAAKRFQGPLLLAGDGAGRLAGECPGALLSAGSGWPEAANFIALAERRFVDGQALPPDPFYLRPPDVTLPVRS